MEIIRENTFNECFEILPAGAIFELNENIYIKTVNDDGDEFAVDLRNGIIYEFNPERLVMPLKAKLFISN